MARPPTPTPPPPLAEKRQIECYWPNIKSWLRNPTAAQPIPTCCICHDELPVRGIERASPSGSPPPGSPEPPISLNPPPRPAPAPTGSSSQPEFCTPSLTLAQLGLEPIPPPRPRHYGRYGWAECEFYRRLRASLAGESSALSMIRQHSLPCFFFCGHIVCRGCLDKEVRLHSLRPRKCPVCMEPFNSDVAGECQHVLFHVLDPGPDGADNLDLCPLTKSEGGELPDLCWNCENLELVVETDSRTSIRKFSAELNLWMLRPYTVIAFHYRHRELGAKRREGRLEVFRGSRTQLIFGLSDLRPVRDATWLGTWRKRCYGFIEKVMVDYETWDSLLPPTLFVLHHVE